MYTYSLLLNTTTILRSDGAHIPADPLNSDYVQYLAWLADGNTPNPAPQPDLSAIITDLSAQIDNLVATVYQNWTRFAQEYINRQTAAQAYANAGFTGTPGIWITSFSDAAGLTAKQGAQLILQQANGLNSALAALAAQRMRKYEIASQRTVVDAQNTYNSIVQDIMSIAATIH
jgi:hypothetical protein